MKNVKKYLKTVTFLFTFGFIAALLISFAFNVDAADSKYIEIVTGTGTNLGDEVKIGDEHFYIISNNGQEIKMLAKYNVDVNVKCTYNYENGKLKEEPKKAEAKENDKEISVDNPGYSPECGIREEGSTGLQSSSITGIPNTTTGEIIGVPFSTDLQKGTDEFAYEGSVIQLYVNAYVAKLKEKYNVDVEGDLLDADLFNKLFYKEDFKNLPSNVKKFVNVTYWTKVKADDGKIMILDAVDQNYFSFNPIRFFSVRPVIIAPATALKEKEVESVCNGNFCFKDNDSDKKVSVSDEICIDQECFYVLSNDNDNVKMLAKYNLNAGVNCHTDPDGHGGEEDDQLTCETANGGSPVKQNVDSRGTVVQKDKTLKANGVVKYSDTASLTEEYVNYINTLTDVRFEGSSITISDIELATGENFDSFAITPKTSESSVVESQRLTGVNEYYNLYQIKTVPDWIYANSYWTGTSSGNDMYVVTSTGVVVPEETTSDHEFGVRPLLTVATDDVPAPEKDTSACYVCGDELVWTDEPDMSSCSINSDITDANMCVNNPETGIKTHTILILIAISMSLITLGVISKLNRFKKI